MTPTERVLRARLGAHTLHATHDSRETTKAAREAFLSKFEREVDPDGVLEPAERSRRAESLRRAHFTRMALAREQKRRQARAAS